MYDMCLSGFVVDRVNMVHATYWETAESAAETLAVWAEEAQLTQLGFYYFPSLYCPSTSF